MTIQRSAATFIAPVGPLREHEVLRAVGLLKTADLPTGADIVRQDIIGWASRKIQGLPQLARGLRTFDHSAHGRVCSAIRTSRLGTEVWALRLDEPDAQVADRVWTTELETVGDNGKDLQLTLRLLAASREVKLNVNPATPALMRGLIDRIGYWTGDCKMSALPFMINSENHIRALVDELVKPERSTPVFVLTGSAYAANPAEPLIDATHLAKMTAGIAKVFVVPATFTYHLRDHLSKPLSVYEGAVRAYLPGFTLEADPYGGHELILPNRLATQDGKAKATSRLQSIAASQSLRRNEASDLPRFSFARLKAHHLQERQVSLAATGASNQVLLEAVQAQVADLQEQVKAGEATQQWLSDEHSEAQTRADAAESQLSKYAFRIQQLTAQLQEAGTEPDSRILPPDSWEVFSDWCDSNLGGRVQLTQRARRMAGDAQHEDLALVSRCFLWLANYLRDARVDGGEGSTRDYSLEENVWNSPCGGDSYMIKWQGQWQDVDWHIKAGGNSRDPRVCLRIYYFWDESLQQVIVDWFPSHKPNGS